MFSLSYKTASFRRPDPIILYLKNDDLTYDFCPANMINLISHCSHTQEIYSVTDLIGMSRVALFFR